MNVLKCTTYDLVLPAVGTAPTRSRFSAPYQKAPKMDPITEQNFSLLAKQLRTELAKQLRTDSATEAARQEASPERPV